MITASSSVMEKSVNRDEPLKAEILWPSKTIMSHYSYKSCEGMSKLFQAMFPDSRIASKFSCGEKKCHTWSVLGTLHTSNYFWRTLWTMIRLMYFLFDESLTSVCRSEQMNIHIRSWNHDKHQDEISCYYTLHCLWVMAQKMTCFLIFVQA